MTNKMIKQNMLIFLALIAFACNDDSIIDKSEKEWLKNHPSLSVGISPNQPPYQFIGEKGEISGMFIDFLTIIEGRLDYKFKKTYQSDWTKLLSDAKNGKVDIVLQIQKTDERKEFLNFTPSLISHKHVIVIRTTRKGITSIGDLIQKKIAVANSYAIQEYILKNYPGYYVIPFFDNITGLRAVSTGQVDAFITQQAVATYYIETEGISNLEIAGEVDYPNELAIASRKNLDTLNIILSKAANSITKTEKQSIYSKWLSYEIKPFYAEANFWIIILIILLVALTFVVLFNLALRARVKQKTKELTTAKEKVEESERILKLFVEHSPASIAMFDNNMYYLIASKRFLADYNLGSQMLTGRLHYEVFPEISERWKEFHRRGLAGETLKEDNDPFPRADGKTDWVRWEIRPWYEFDNQIGGIILFSEVITAQIEDREALRESEKYNRMLFEQSPIGLALTSFDGKLIDINTTFAKIIGCTIEEAKKMTYWDITPQKYAEQEKNQLELLEKTGSYGSYEKEYIHKDGHLVPIRLQGNMIERDNQKYIWSSVEDITEHKRLDEQIREKDIQFGKLSANMSDLIFQFTRRTDGTYFVPIASKGIINIFGCSPEDVLEDFAPIARAILPEDSEMVINAIEYSAKHISDFSCEFRVHLPDKAVQWIYSKSTPERLADGSVTWYGFNTDITQRKLAEVALEKSRIGLQEALELSNRSRKSLLSVLEDQQRTQIKINTLNKELEQRVIDRTAQFEASNKELEAFSYSVSHDLRAPLRHISGYVNLLNERYSDELPEKALHYLETVTNAAKQMGMLIDDLLQFSRTGRQEVHQTTTDMNLLIKEVLEKIKPDTENRKINWSVQELPEVFGDYSLLKQVWLNLLDNAIKYTRNKRLAEISIGCTINQENIVFFVRDNGVGFDMKYAHKLFGVFQRLHTQAEFEGTGIGLANVQRIIVKHSGQVWAEAKPDLGATFFFSLPKK